jgi:hypothetical protein
VVAAQRHLNAKTSIADIAAKWRMTGRKLAQAHGVMIKQVHPFLTRI